MTRTISAREQRESEKDQYRERRQRREVEIREQFDEAQAAHTRATSQLQFAKNRDGVLTRELHRLPEGGHKQIDNLQARARDLFATQAIRGAWFASLTSNAAEIARIPPSELAVLHLLATDSSFAEALHGVIDFQVASREHAGFTKRPREEVEKERLELRKRMLELEREKAKASERLQAAGARLREWGTGRDV